jgi:CRP/FNR family transcriptional regulator, dissimilatory nitrate respiration regulator
MARGTAWDNLPLFGEMSAEHRRALQAISRPCRFRRGEVLFSEGEAAEGFHVVLEGKVRVFKSSLEGKEQTLHIWGPGEPVGEVAALRGDRYPARAEALEACRTLFVPRAGLLDLVRGEPEFALRLLSLLALRLENFARLVENLTLKEVPERLAAYLLLVQKEQGGGKDLELELTKAQVAGLLGTIPETLSRILARMAREELIRLEGTRGVRILDESGLMELAAGERRLTDRG